MEHEGRRSYEAVTAYFEQIMKESERGQVLISCSFLEDTLGRMLKSFLVKSESSNKLLTGFNAPLSTFSARIKACNAMGLLTNDEMMEIEIHRKIRNKFAHQISMSFEDQSVVDLCLNLTRKTEQFDADKPTARENYVSSTTIMNLTLISRLSRIPNSRLSSQFEGDP